jgi:transcriptional regulator with XRE-family HTH domain
MKKSQLSLGDRIKQIRKQKGLTQDQVAEAAGIDSKSLSRIECNRFNPAIDTLQALAVALDVDIKDFFDQDTESSRALRAFLFELIATSSDKQVVELAEAVKKTINKQNRVQRNVR